MPEMPIEKIIEYDNKIKELAKILDIDYTNKKYLDLLAEYWPPVDIDFKDLFTIKECSSE